MSLYDRMPEEPEHDEGPYVCPGCYAIGEATCAPGCIDAEIERMKAYDAETREMYVDLDPDDGEDIEW